MFTSQQIIPATRMIKHFSAYSTLLDHQPQALLITQKSRDSLVLVNAQIFEDLLQQRFEIDLAEGLDPREAAERRLGSQ